MTLLEKNARENPAKWYPILVREFIKEQYSLEDELAIRNNYDLDPEKYRAEYEEYQSWRLQCKARAKEICGIS